MITYQKIKDHIWKIPIKMKSLKIIKDIIKFALVRKKKWLIPFAILLVAIAVVLVTAQGSVIAPFIYTLF